MLGLSGGIDSALTAAIAAEALGRENVRGVALPSQFSSPGSLDDARKLAENLGIADRLTQARKTLAAVESPDYPKTLTGTLGAEPIENYISAA